MPRVAGLVLVLSVVLLSPSLARAAETLAIFQTYGSTGTEAGQLSGPIDLTADAEGFVYVADSENHRIQKFAPDGTVVWVKGKRGEDGLPASGSEPLEFSRPKDVAIDPDGDVLVADTDNSRVQRLGPDGSFKGQFTAGTGVGPQSISIAADGSIFVTDTSDHQVIRYSATGAELNRFGGFGAGPGQLDTPFDVSVQGDSVYVADTENERIQRFSLTGTLTGGWGTEGDKPGQFQRPGSVAAGTNGRVYVADRELNRIDEFTADGAFLRRFGHERQLAEPGGVFAIGDRVYVADTNHDRVLLLLNAQTPPPGSYCAADTGSCDLGPNGVPVLSMPGGDRSPVRFFNPQDACRRLDLGEGFERRAFYNGKTYDVQQVAGGFMVEIPPEDLANATLVVNWRCRKPSASAGGARAAQGGFDFDEVNETWGETALYDPSGFVRDARTRKGIEDATVTLQGAPLFEGPFAFADPLSVSPRVNPQRTDARGHYGWDVPNGYWRIKVERFGYRPLRASRVVSVPPPVTDLHVELRRDPGEQARLIGPRGVGRLRLGMKRKQARTVARGMRPRPRLGFRRGRLNRIELGSDRYRTGANEGVGSTEARLRLSYGARLKRSGSASSRKYRLGRITFIVRGSDGARGKARRVVIGG